MSAQRGSPETIPDFGAGDPKYAKLERVFQLHRTVGPALEVGDVKSELFSVNVVSPWAWLGAGQPGGHEVGANEAGCRAPAATQGDA